MQIQVMIKMNIKITTIAIFKMKLKKKMRIGTMSRDCPILTQRINLLVHEST